MRGTSNAKTPTKRKLPKKKFDETDDSGKNYVSDNDIDIYNAVGDDEQPCSSGMSEIYPTKSVQTSPCIISMTFAHLTRESDVRFLLVLNQSIYSNLFLIL